MQILTRIDSVCSCNKEYLKESQDRQPVKAVATRNCSRDMEKNEQSFCFLPDLRHMTAAEIMA